MIWLWLLGCGAGPAAFDPTCGDGTVHEGEVCDDGVNDGRHGGCEPGCAARAGYCGDGAVDDEEACDDGVNDGAYGSCAADCSASAGWCGDGEVNGPERCDDGTNRGGYGGCRAGCMALGPRCGDGTVNGPEGCDDGVNDGQCGSCTEDCAAEATAPHLVEVVVRAIGGDYGWPVDTPDVFIEVRDAARRLVFVSAVVIDRDPPVTFALDGVRVDGEVWSVHVWDEDGGAFGEDDDMGAVSVDTSLATGTVTRAGTRVSWVVEERTCE